MIDIKGLNKADILAALYNNSKPLGLGFLHYKHEEMDIKEAEELIKESKYFDYLHGRVMKVDLSYDEFNEELYDRDNGRGAAERVIKNLKIKKIVSEAIKEHILNKYKNLTSNMVLVDVFIQDDFIISVKLIISINEKDLKVKLKSSIEMYEQMCGDLIENINNFYIHEIDRKIEEWRKRNEL